MSEDTVSQIKDRIRLSSFISRYTRIEDKGLRKVCLCPFHDDHNPSMQIDDEGRISVGAVVQAGMFFHF